MLILSRRHHPVWQIWRQASESAGIYVDRFILNPLASADAILTEQERESGVVVIDIGGGTTDIAIYVEGTVWHTAVIPIGGDHVTNDITYLLNAPFALAEDVKIKHGHARQGDVNELDTFLVEPFGDGIPQEISRKELAMVIEARVEENCLNWYKKKSSVQVMMAYCVPER